MRRSPPGRLVGLVRELRAVASDARPLPVERCARGAELAPRARARGRRAARPLEGDPARRGAARARARRRRRREDDERVLRAASRARTSRSSPSRPAATDVDVPYVLATDVVPCPPGRGLPGRGDRRAIARRLGEEGTALAARLPVLRGPSARADLVVLAPERAPRRCRLRPGRRPAGADAEPDAARAAARAAHGPRSTRARAARDPRHASARASAFARSPASCSTSSRSRAGH